MIRNRMIGRFAWILALVLFVTTMATCGIAEMSTDTSEDEWQSFLLLGEDSRSTSHVERSDVNLILFVNEAAHKAKLVSVMRDTWVDFPGTDKSGKINAGTVYGGPELTMQTMNEYFGTNIEKYVLVNFDNVIQFIDILGGVDIEITEGERRVINRRLKDTKVIKSSYTGERYISNSGLVHMNGAMAVSYVRDRYSSSSGDFDRVVRQRTLLKAMLDVAKKSTLNEIVQLTLSFLSNIKTNMSIMDIMSLIPFALEMNLDDVEECTLPFKGTYTSGMMGGVWKIVPDFEQNREMLHAYIYED